MNSSTTSPSAATAATAATAAAETPAASSPAAAAAASSNTTSTASKSATCTTTPNSKQPQAQGAATAAAAAAPDHLPAAVDFEPPLACVRRILKNTLPASTNVGKDASAAFARASGIFIIYLTACANDFAREHKRQTITANDVLAAIKVRRRKIYSSTA